MGVSSLTAVAASCSISLSAFIFFIIRGRRRRRPCPRPPPPPPAAQSPTTRAWGGYTSATPTTVSSSLPSPATRLVKWLRVVPRGVGRAGLHANAGPCSPPLAVPCFPALPHPDPSRLQPTRLDFLLLPACLQFGHQEPGTHQEIQEFVATHYPAATFPLMAKVDVNGGAAHPLFAWLKAHTPAAQGAAATGADIRWNFEKFLFDKHGHAVQRYGSSAPRRCRCCLPLLLLRCSCCCAAAVRAAVASHRCLG